MTSAHLAGLSFAAALHLALSAGFSIRAILRPRRSPASRIAWVAALFAAPFVGACAYLLLGETKIGVARRRRERQAKAAVAAPPQEGGAALSGLPPDRAGLFRLGAGMDGFPAVAGNLIALASDSNDAIERMVEAIDAAREHVHLCFYIWLEDNNGTAMLDALERAARRGVATRVLVDSLGSRALVRSPRWAALTQAGVETRVALPIGNPLIRLYTGRADLRVHRKNVVIDHEIAFLGSQNCADPEFRVKAKFAPWVDIWLRVEGPVAQSCQRIFVEDWAVAGGSDLSGLLRRPIAPREGGALAQAIGAGPTSQGATMSDLFCALMAAAREELIVTTPYFVPDEAIQSALCGAARRGVATTLILPARNDSRFVAAASRSYYAELLEAGVALHEFEGGLLHAKTLTLDGEVALVGSANLDRRSFELNYENNLLFISPQRALDVRARQFEWRARARPVSRDEVARWSAPRRFRQNAAAMLGPIL